MPQTMTSYQFQVLNDVISPRQSFEFSYYHNEDVQDNLKFEEIVQYIDSLQTRGR